jgi:hypothetical protein
MKNIYNTNILIIIFACFLLFGYVLFFYLDNEIFTMTNNNNESNVNIEKLTMTYDNTNLNIQYHDNIEDINSQSRLYKTDFSSINVIDQHGNVVLLPYTPVQGMITYYKPGTYYYGATAYVPTYEDSIYFSKTIKKIKK